MRNIISFKVQKILMFIPMINGLNTLVWGYNYCVAVKKISTLALSFLLIIAVWLPYMILGGVVDHLIVSDYLSTLLHRILFYLSGVLLSFVLIRFQRKVIPEEYQND